MTHQDGIVLLNKPSGVTSFDALRKIKAKSSGRKVGHTGTLDKFAQGLLVVLVGNYTRLNHLFTNLDKSYVGEMTFGQETDTLDPEGRVVKTAPAPSSPSWERVVDSFTGRIQQSPPVYSAIHLDGVRAHKRARRNEEFEPPARWVEIRRLELLEWHSPTLSFRVECSKGTYVRSLARDIGSFLGSCAYLTSLVRTSVGGYKLDNSVTPDQYSPGEHLNFGRRVFGGSGIDAVTRQVKRDHVDAILCGTPLQEGYFVAPPDGEGLQVLFHEDRLLGLAELRDGSYKYRLVAPSNR